MVYDLKQDFAGVTDPAEMGTTGLIAWVIAGPGDYLRSWQRSQRAAAVICRRGLPLDRFADAVLAALPNRWYHTRIARHFDALLAIQAKRGDRS